MGEALVFTYECNGVHTVHHAPGRDPLLRRRRSTSLTGSTEQKCHTTQSHILAEPACKRESSSRRKVVSLIDASVAARCTSCGTRTLQRHTSSPGTTGAAVANITRGNTPPRINGTLHRFGLQQLIEAGKWKKFRSWRIQHKEWRSNDMHDCHGSHSHATRTFQRYGGSRSRRTLRCDGKHPST